MSILFRGAALAAACAALAGCATVTRGSSTEVSVVSEPPGATVKTSTGASCSPTPCALHVSRRQAFSATVSRPGFKDGAFQVSPYLSAPGTVALFGNVIIGGLIGIAVDMTTGAPFDLSPSPVAVTLESSEVALPLAYAPPPVPAGAGLGDAASYGGVQPAVAYAAPAGGRNTGRVVQIVVLPNGGYAEIHEPGAAAR